MWTNNIFILTNNNFADIKKNAIKSVKIMTNNRKYFILTYLLKFNSV